MTVKTGVVSSFTGEYFWLSNFYEAEFTWRSVAYRSGEHAFQAAKAYAMAEPRIHDMQDHIEKVRDAPTPAKAKYYGRSVKIDLEQWETMKVQYMREIVHAKFSQVKGLAGQLISTGAMLLVEGNDWQDGFWGRYRNDQGKIVGLNTLGTILMEERGYWLYSNFEDKK